MNTHLFLFNYIHCLQRTSIFLISEKYRLEGQRISLEHLLTTRPKNSSQGILIIDVWKMKLRKKSRSFSLRIRQKCRYRSRTGIVNLYLSRWIIYGQLIYRITSLFFIIKPIFYRLYLKSFKKKTEEKRSERKHVCKDTRNNPSLVLELLRGLMGRREDCQSNTHEITIRDTLT